MPTCPKCRGENPELGAKCPRDGYYYIYQDAVSDAEKDEWLGRLAADKYVILGLISEGGMGAVYRAMQLPVQREVAFKVLRAELQDSDQGKDRFAREARAVSKLTHPNIITMHDFGVDDEGHPFMVMEYAPGTSLADWIRQPGLDLDRICHVFRQILSALAEAHQQGIIHRDLKPENLIVTKAGSDGDYIKLLDFGIARMVHDGATRGLTREGEVFGTPHYMAPEQAQGKKDIGPPADVYALGIMFYEMLSGECPFDAPTPLSILYMHINDDLPALTPRTGVSLPQALRQIIEKATAKAPDKRYGSAGEMLEAFDCALGNTSGLYAAPAGLSSEGIRHTQNMGAKGRVERATADTLHFEEPSNQRVTDSSNGVPVHDPQMGGTTTFELDALNPRSGAKLLIAGIICSILLGVGATLMFGGDDNGSGPSGEVEATAATQKDDGESRSVGANDALEPSAPKAEADNDTGAADEDSAAEIAAAEDKSQPAEEEPTADEETTAAFVDEDDKEKQEAGEMAASKPAAADTKRSDHGQANTKSAGGRSEDPATDTKASSPNTETTAAVGEEPDQPKKFQPKKFRPKPSLEDDSDDEPKKFEPKKWR